jgi:hypothetical protein
VRENSPLLGNLVSDFDFNQSPRAPMVLPQQAVAPVPGKATGDWVTGTITRQTPQLIKLQISSTDRVAKNLLGKQIRLALPPGTPIYFGGRSSSKGKLAVGDAVVAIIVPGDKYHVAHEIDDLGR